MKSFMTAGGLAPVLVFAASAAPAAEVRLTIKDGKFDRAEPHSPASEALTIIVKNLESTASEFESKTLKVEKIVTPGSEITMRIRPLNPGLHHFINDFRGAATQGDLVVE